MADRRSDQSQGRSRFPLVGGSRVQSRGLLVPLRSYHCHLTVVYYDIGADILLTLEARFVWHR